MLYRIFNENNTKLQLMSDEIKSKSLTVWRTVIAERVGLLDNIVLVEPVGFFFMERGPIVHRMSCGLDFDKCGLECGWIGALSERIACQRVNVALLSRRLKGLFGRRLSRHLLIKRLLIDLLID